MKFVLTSLLLLFISIAFSQSIRVEVKDENGSFMDVSTEVEILFLSTDRRIKNKLNSNGVVTFKNPYSATMKSPLIKIIVRRENFEEVTTRLVWEGDIVLPMVLSQSSEIEVTKADLEQVQGRIQKDIDKATATLIAHTEGKLGRGETNDNSIDLDELKALIKDLDTEQQKVKKLKERLTDRDIDVNKLNGELEDIKIKYRVTKEELERLQIVEARYAELIYDISIELKECRCLAWGKNYIEIYFKLINGNTGNPVPNTYNFDFNILVGEKNKQNSSERNLVFESGLVELEKRYYIDEYGYMKVALIFRENEIEKREKMVRNNYFIYFYNKKLYGFRDKYKISMGKAEILNLVEECGKRKPLKITPRA